jgi:hypothetical protein
VTDASGDVPLSTYELFSAIYRLGEMTMARMMARLSTRFPDRQGFVATTELPLNELLARDPLGLDLGALPGRWFASATTKS